MGNSNKKLDELEINLNEEIIRHLFASKGAKRTKSKSFDGKRKNKIRRVWATNFFYRPSPFYRQNRPIQYGPYLKLALPFTPLFIVRAELFTPLKIVTTSILNFIS